MKTYKGRGIVLHTLKYGDSSMVAYLLTDVGGRRSYMVQGVRSRSGRGSKLALFQFSCIFYKSFCYSLRFLSH